MSRYVVGCNISGAIVEQDEHIRARATSFIVRVWNDSGSTPHMRGEIEHVGTGEKRFFIDYWSLLNTIDTWREDLETSV